MSELHDLIRRLRAYPLRGADPNLTTEAADALSTLSAALESAQETNRLLEQFNEVLKGERDEIKAAAEHNHTVLQTVFHHIVLDLDEGMIGDEADSSPEAAAQAFIRAYDALKFRAERAEEDLDKLEDEYDLVAGEEAFATSEFLDMRRRIPELEARAERAEAVIRELLQAGREGVRADAARAKAAALLKEVSP